CLDQSLRDVMRRLEVRLVGDEDGELVAAEPRRQVGRTEVLADSLADGRQEGVARRVAERVVDELEVIEVQEDHRRDAARWIRRREAPPEPLREQRAVRKTRERVVVRLVPQLFLELRERGERLLQLAVLEGNGSVIRECLEQPLIVSIERADVAEP